MNITSFSIPPAPDLSQAEAYLKRNGFSNEDILNLTDEEFNVLLDLVKESV